MEPINRDCRGNEDSVIFFIIVFFALFTPNPQAKQKERSHERLGISKVLARKENR